MHKRQGGLGLCRSAHTIGRQTVRAQAGQDAVGNQFIIFNQQHAHGLSSMPDSIQAFNYPSVNAALIWPRKDACFI